MKSAFYKSTILAATIALIVSSLQPAVADDAASVFENLNDNENKDEKWLIMDESARAQDVVYETKVVGARLRNTDETTGFAETIEIDDQRKSLVSVADELARSVGVQVRTMGGLGAFGSASIRGSTPNQVPIFLDRVELNTAGFGMVDLGDLSLDLIDSIEVYRGCAPLALGTSGIGGAIVLNTRKIKEPVSEAATSYGSWNTWRVFGLGGSVIGPVTALVILSGQGSSGDFIYFNRNGTDFETDDDRFEKRTNNHNAAYSWLAKLNASFEHWTAKIMNDLTVKRQGLPGPDSFAGVSEAELGTLSNTTNLTLGRGFSDRLKIDFDVAYTLTREDFDNEGDIGIGYRRSRYSTDAIFGSALLNAKLSRHNASTFRVAARYERYDQEELLLPEDQQQGLSRRIRGEAGIEHDWSPIPTLHIVPAIRTELHYSSFGGGPVPELLMDLEPSTVTDLFLSPSMGARFEIVKGLTLRANSGRYVRTPLLTELFGDRGVVIGNPKLKPEIGYNVDAGFTYISSWPSNHSLLRMNAAWFAGWVDDLIALEANSQHTSYPVNIDAAQIQGIESALSISFLKLFALSGNYTYFYGINESGREMYQGKRLPGRPAHEVYGRVDIGKTMERFGGAVWFDVDYASKAYFGQYNNEAYVSKHFFLGLGNRFEIARAGLSLTVEIKNLLNSLAFTNDLGTRMPISDYNRYPLPGRTIIGTIHLKMP